MGVRRLLHQPRRGRPGRHGHAADAARRGRRHLHHGRAGRRRHHAELPVHQLPRRRLCCASVLGLRARAGVRGLAARDAASSTPRDGCAAEPADALHRAAGADRGSWRHPDDLRSRKHPLAALRRPPRRACPGPAGAGLPTASCLDFERRMPRARDAVHCRWTRPAARGCPRRRGPDRSPRYQRGGGSRGPIRNRPDLGRRLDRRRARQLAARVARRSRSPSSSPTACRAHRRRRATRADRVGPARRFFPATAGSLPCSSPRGARVALADPIGEPLGARLVLIAPRRAPGPLRAPTASAPISPLRREWAAPMPTATASPTSASAGWRRRCAAVKLAGLLTRRAPSASAASG